MEYVMQIEKIKIVDLKNDLKNARTHSLKNLAAIKGSLNRFGQQKPIVIGKDNTVIAGNGTLAAAAELGWDTVDAVRTDLSGSKATAYALADNRAGELAAWDFDLLSDSLSELLVDDFNIEEFGFDDTYIRVKQEPGTAINHKEEDQWQGMPEYDQNDETGFRKIIVHFKDAEAVERWAEKMEQTITNRTKFIWYPKVEHEKFVDKLYES